MANLKFAIVNYSKKLKGKLKGKLRTRTEILISFHIDWSSYSNGICGRKESTYRLVSYDKCENWTGKDTLTFFL